MSVIPCEKNSRLTKLIEDYAETLKTRAHELGDHGLTEEEFYEEGVFRGAIERVRGQFSATMRRKREFVRNVLNHMEDDGVIESWDSTGDSNRHDYIINMTTGRVSVVELKGCLDGNNTTIFERPAHAQEFIIWSVCTNQGADPRKNAWSGIHTRLSADMIERGQRVDGIIVWDSICGTIGRPCPKVTDSPERRTTVANVKLPPPCIYVFPSTIASPRNNPRPTAQTLNDVHLLNAFHRCFKGNADEVNYVDFEVVHDGPETLRRTRIRRAGLVAQESEMTPIQRQ